MSKKLRNEPLTTKYREKEFKSDGFRSLDEKTVYCDFCEHTIDWRRRNTCVDHIASKKHINAKKKHTPGAPVQSSLSASFGGHEARADYLKDLITCITNAGLSLEVVDHFRPFLKKHTKHGGAVPSVHELRKYHVDKVFNEHQAQLKEIVKDQPIHVAFDETTDRKDFF
jgi:hypothetical protein